MVSERLYIEEDNRLLGFYVFALLAIVYAGLAGNLVSFVLGIAIFIWTAVLRFKGGIEAEQDEEGDEEVKEEIESTTDE